MKAITRDKYGTADVLQIEDMPIPEPADDELLIRVHHTTVNRTDCSILSGKPFVTRFFTGLINPSFRVTGTDFAGEVVKIGEKVHLFSEGNRVWGLNDQGLASHAEYMTIKEDKAVALIPDNFIYAEAVACAEGAHYAYNFVNKISLKSSDKVLVIGATGAIGSAALQILKSQGIYVTAVGNTKNIELLRSLGADKVYSYEKESFTAIDKEKYNFVLDAVGKSSFGECKKLLLPKGIYISSELGPHYENLYLPLITKWKGSKRVIFPIPSDAKRSVLYLSELMEKGQFRAVIDRHYPAEEIKEAYEYVQSGQKTGNVIIDFTTKTKGNMARALDD
jgi:NADPH:quinone reductase-like Zn-dependent oxidoreductase